MRRDTLLASCCTALLLSGCGSHTTTGDGGDNTPPSTTPPTPTTSSVSGTVLDEANNPVANARVMVLGGSAQPVTTDSTGTFTLADVAATYDIAAANSTHTNAIVYQAVTLRSLTLHVTTGATPGTNSASVGGTVSGGQTPYGSLNAPAVSFQPQQSLAVASATANSSGNYSMSATWNGPPSSLAGSIYAFQAVRSSAGSVPTSFTGYGRRDNVTLLPSNVYGSQDVHLDSVASSTLGFGVVVPSGLSLLASQVVFTGQGDAFVPLILQSSPSGISFSYAVPQVPQATFAVVLSASPGGYSQQVSVVKTGLTAGTSNTTITLPALLQLNQPAHLSTNITRTTDFSWSGLSGGVHLLTLGKVSTTDTAYGVTVVTADTHTALPDLTALGMPLPANTSFAWSVQGQGPYASVDALLQRASSGAPLQYNATHDSLRTVSDSRGFTTSSAP